MKKIVSLVLLSLALTGCASREPTPGWVYGEAKGYPASAYLIGRGQADNAVDARDRARADLAKVFEVRIEERTHDRSSHEVGTAGSVSSSEVARELSTRIERVVTGVEIADHWHDRASGTYHALAVLPRARAAHALREEIASLDAATEAHLEQARRHPELFGQLRSAAQAIAAQQQRAELQQTLRILDATGQGVPPRWALGRLQADYTELLMRISVRPESSGQHAALIRDALSGALGHAGFTVTAAAEYTVFARLDVEELAPRDGWHWRNGILELALRDGRGQTIGSQRWLLREAATDPKQAERRVVERAATTLETELAATLMRFAE